MVQFVPTGMIYNPGQPDDGHFGIAAGVSDIIRTPALVGSSNQPILTMGAATIVGTGGNASITGTNLSGVINFTTGTGLLSLGKALSIVFANSFSYPSGCVITFAAGNQNFASIVNKLSVTTSPSGGDLYVGLSALTITTQYIGYYQVTGW